MVKGKMKIAHPEVVLPGVSDFFAVIKFFTFDLACGGGEGPDGALLIVQLFSGLFAEPFAGDKFRHEVHILSSIAVKIKKKPDKLNLSSQVVATGLEPVTPSM